MKKFYYLVAGVLSMGMLASCSNEDEIAAGNQGNQQGEAYLMLSLVGSDNGASRTQPGQGTEEGLSDPDENAINSVMILLADDQGKITSYSPSLTTIEGVRTTERISVGTGDYEVYVIANPPQGYTAPTTKIELTTTAIIDDISAATMGTYAGDGSFLMFSACHGANQTDGVEVTVSSSNTYDDPATATVQLDRLAAKITYDAADLDFQDAQEMFDENTTLSNVAITGFALVNGVTKTYLQQHWSGDAASAINDQPTPPATALKFANTLITPTVTNNSATDFYNRWDDYSIINPDPNRDGWYTDVIDNTVGKDNVFTTGRLYCMENNSGSTKENCFIKYVTDLNGNTTGVLFRAQATIKGSDNNAGENCFYGYEGQYFATLQALATEFPSVFGSEEVTDVAAALAAAYNGTAAEGAPIQTVADFREAYNVRVFEDGIMYYTHYIMDQNYTAKNAEGTQVNYHSVMRNTIYGLTVTSVIGIGDDVPGGWNPDVEPEEPVIPDTYLRVRCMVNPWVLSNYDVTLQ